MRCPQCKSEISAYAKICPFCRSPLSSDNWTYPIIIWGVIIIVGLGIISAVFTAVGNMLGIH